MRKNTLVIILLLGAITIPTILAHPALATDGNVMQVQGFIKNVIKLATGIAGLIAAGFFVVGGFGYITSSGHPAKLERAKHTIVYSGIGLAIVIAAFVISSIVTNLAISSFGS